jgi:hypothetical protein
VGTARLDPRRFLAERASVAFSSYQLLCFVASLTLLIVALRSAVYTVEFSSKVELVLVLEDAVIAPVFFLLLLTLCPDSSSEEVYAEEPVSSAAGGGVDRRFLKFDLAERFLKTTGSAAVRVWADSISLRQWSSVFHD